MTRPRVIILSGYGLNCEEETAHAFKLAGADADIVHINDLIGSKGKLKQYQILAVPGGFSYGDDTGSGKAYANKLRNHLQEELEKFANEDKLVIGICNGFQILTSLRLLPGALTFNDSARYIDRWVDLKTRNNAESYAERRGNVAQALGSPVGNGLDRSKKGRVKTRPYTGQQSPWLTGITKLSLPIAHGEGKFIADKKILQKLKEQKAIAFKYDNGEICHYQTLPYNPNGAMMDIAGVTSHKGRVLGMMPHPERAIFFTQLPHWTYLKEKLRREGKPIPTEGPGLQIFKNAVKYFS